MHVPLGMRTSDRGKYFPIRKFSSTTFRPMTSGGRLSKKRAAPSLIGPKPKKVHSEGRPTKDKKLDVVKRGRPVTLPQTLDSDTSSDEESRTLSEEDAKMTDEDEEMGETPDLPAKDPNGRCQVYASESEPRADGLRHTAAKEAHKAQKILLNQRKAFKPHATLLRDAKRVWSLARQKNIGSERKKHIADLMSIVRGHVKDIVFKHDASRIIQTIVRWGGHAERNEIAAELKGSFKDLSESKYSKVHSSVHSNPHDAKPDWNSS